MPALDAKKRFGPFELDSRSGELRTNGTRIKLQGQPISVLQILLETPGELVTREQIHQRLWSSDTFVDFDHNLNTAIKKLRQALGDEAETPRYIETIPRYGYRFIGQVENAAPQEAAVPSQESAETEPASAESEVVSHPTQPQWWRTAAIASTALILVALAFLLWRQAHWQTSGAQRTPVQVPLVLPTMPGIGAAGVAVSPNGQYLVYMDDTPMGTLRLMDLRKGTEEELPGTELAAAPFWSPDGRHIGFFSVGKLKKIALDSRIVSVICQHLSEYASWGTSGIILVDSVRVPHAISVDSGEVHDVFAQTKDFIDIRPSFLPDGKHFLFVRLAARELRFNLQAGTLYMGALDGSAPRSLNLRVVQRPEYRSGYLLYATEHGLFAQRFDPDAGRLMGQPSLLMEAEGAQIAFTASDNGVLVSRPVDQDVRMTLYSRNGKADPAPVAEGLVDEARFSPDGTLIAYAQIIDETRDIWVYDLNRRVSQRITPGDASYYGPVWSPDGKLLAYNYWRPGVRGIEIRNVDGSSSPKTVLQTSSEDPLQYWVRSWGAQGDCLFITVTKDQGPRKMAVFCLSGDRKLHQLPDPKATSRFAQRISPDGKWLAYSSTETGRPEIFVQPFPGPGPSVRVSLNGGNFPEWRKDGRELFFLSPDQKVETAPVSYAADGIKVGEPIELFAPPGSLQNPVGIPFDAAPDGKTFAVTTLPPETKTRRMIVNWDAGLPH